MYAPTPRQAMVGRGAGAACRGYETPHESPQECPSESFERPATFLVRVGRARGALGDHITFRLPRAAHDPITRCCADAWLFARRRHRRADSTAARQLRRGPRG